MARLPLAALLLAAVAARASADAGRTGAVTLSRPLGARAVALADAFVAVDGGLDSLTFNPAGLAGLEQPELRSDYTHGIVDDSFSFLGYAQRVKPVVLGAGAAYYDAGTITLNLSDGTQGPRKVEQDYVGLLSAAGDLGGGLAAGVTAKYYRFNLAQAAKASGAAFDAGARWATPLQGLSFGAALQNAGAAVKFEQAGDPLPRTLRAGAAFALRLEPAAGGDAAVSFDRFLFTADVISALGEPVAAATGVEARMPLGPRDFLALRAGYQFNNAANGLALGLGFREGRFLLDYAMGLQKSLGNAHHLSLGVRF